eukprot:483461_1
MSMMETEGSGEAAIKNTAITKWMEQNHIQLSSDTYSKLSDNGFKTISDLQNFSSASELYKCCKHDMNILVLDAIKLKNAFDKFGIVESNKKLWHDIEETTNINSMKLQIDKLENVINNLLIKETNIENEKQKIEHQITETFNKLTQSLNKRKSILLSKLNEIINQKSTYVKTNMVKYKNAIDTATKIKYESDNLIQTPITIDEMTDRKLKIVENEKKITQIVNDILKSNTEINEKICLAIDVKNATAFMNSLGTVSDIIAPVLKAVEYDNNNPDGYIKVLWKIPMVKKDGKRKINIEYMKAEYKNDYDDNKDDVIDMDDEKKWDVIVVDNNSGEGIEKVSVEKIGTYIFKMKYYAISGKMYSPYSNIKSINVTNILGINSCIIDVKEKNILIKWIFEHIVKKNNKKSVKLSLLYRMSRDGADINTAHSKYL